MTISKNRTICDRCGKDCTDEPYYHNFGDATLCQSCSDEWDKFYYKNVSPQQRKVNTDKERVAIWDKGFEEFMRVKERVVFT